MHPLFAAALSGLATFVVVWLGIRRANRRATKRRPVYVRQDGRRRLLDPGCVPSALSWSRGYRANADLPVAYRGGTGVITVRGDAINHDGAVYFRPDGVYVNDGYRFLEPDSVRHRVATCAPEPITPKV